MGLGPKTAVIDGQRVSVPTYDSFNPVGYGQQVQLQPIRNIGIPPMAGASGGAAGSNQYPEEVGGYGTAGNNHLATQVAGANPWNLRVSPTPWAIIFLGVGLFMLAAIHWRKTTLAGFRENADVGPAREAASGSV